MCLAIPGKIKSIETMYDGLVRMAKIQFGGIVKQASLEMVPKAKIGDYVLVHVGVAISIVDEEEAKKSFEYLEMIGEIDELIEHTQTDRNDLPPLEQDNQKSVD
ncbi:HypC/HybG/HupF family hydrogenase formation chaperone [Pararhodonellum marinum]|uniref:HypC/HybG/HupF family hydrogenase formation chaperone n=1 Tax=Pararhodonellum marinum TaxID=2755358 RepID=UPI00188FDB5A|nr:HypC/HybG/HupF family hydrogenase formation chaperone [Pararhodonellum marinum]